MSIRIRCKQPGFRRAGVAHVDDRIWPAGAFSEEQLALLKAEPMLIVEELGQGSLSGILAAMPIFAAAAAAAALAPAGAEAPSPILEAQPAADAEGQQAEPEPGADEPSPDAGALEPEAGNAPASDPAPETGEAAEADPVAASEAANKAPGKRPRKS